MSTIRTWRDIIAAAYGSLVGWKTIIDSGDAASYSGSGQPVLDRSGLGTDFNRGATSGAEGSDPTFAGAAGGLSINDRFTLDGGDYFTLASTPTWVDNLHKNNAKFSFLVAFKYKASAAVQRILGTSGASSLNRGISVFSQSGSFNLRVGNGTVASMSVAFAAPAVDSYVIIVGSVDEAAGASGGFVACNGVVTTFDATYTSPASTAAPNALNLMAGGAGNTPVLNGSEFFAAAFLEGAVLTQAQAQAIYAEGGLRLLLTAGAEASFGADATMTVAASVDDDGDDTGDVVAEPIYAIAALPISAFDEPPPVTTEDLLRLNVSPIIDLVYLLELTPFTQAGEIDLNSAGIGAIAALPIAAVEEDVFGTVSAPVPFYFSDIGWTGEPDDPDAPNRHYAPRIAPGGTLRLDRSIPITPDAARRVMMQLGDVTLVNGDRALDDMVRSMAIDGRRVRVLVGPRTGAYADFEVLFQGTASGWKLAGDGSIALSLRDASWQLDAPAQRNLYDGSGMAGGGQDVKNKPIPLCYGENLNVPLAYIDTTNRVFQVHDGPIEAVLAVYDAGLALTPGADVTDIWAASPPSAGTFITQRSGGYIRVGDKPLGTVTADVRGDKAFGSYISTAGGIAFRIAHDRGGIADMNFDLTSFELLNNAQGAPVGIYTGLVQFTIADLWNAIFSSIGGWYGANRFDLLEVGRLDLPGARALARLSTVDITALELLDTPATISPPIWKVRVGFQRNWTPNLSAIAGAVTDDRLAFLANEYRYGSFEDPDLTIAHLRAQEITLPGLFANEDDATAEAERLQTLYAGPFQLARLHTKLQGYLIPLSRTINSDYPRYGLAGGKNVLTAGQAIDGSRNKSTVDFLY